MDNSCKPKTFEEAEKRWLKAPKGSNAEKKAEEDWVNFLRENKPKSLEEGKARWKSAAGVDGPMDEAAKTWKEFANNFDYSTAKTIEEAKRNYENTPFISGIIE